MGSKFAVNFPQVEFPFELIDSSDPSHIGRIRVVNGLLGGLLPAQMHVPDIILPVYPYTDYHCYLTLAAGTNYILGKVAVDNATGMFSGASVYASSSPFTPDGNYAYIQIGTAYLDSGGVIQITSQDLRSNESLIAFFSSDGSLIIPAWAAI
jgi:hypothetical protein